jgi:hypothetical protein
MAVRCHVHWRGRVLEFPVAGPTAAWFKWNPQQCTATETQEMAPKTPHWLLTAQGNVSACS